MVHSLASPFRERSFPMFVGCGRSGTTLVRAIFDSHSQLAVAHHAQFIVTMGRQRRRYEDVHGLHTEPFLANLFASHRFPLLQLSEDEVRQAFQEPTPSYADAVRRVLRLFAVNQGKPRYADKTPGHVVRIGLLSELFPEARFVHVIRDGRSSWLGYRERGFGPQSLADAAFNWKGRVLRGRTAGFALGPSRYQEVRYEDLVEDPEATLEPLCRFLDLQYEPGMLAYHERVETVLAGMGTSGRTAFENIAQPLTKGMRDWRQELSVEEQELFDAIAGELLDELGYERTPGAASASLKLDVVRHWLDWQQRRTRFQLTRLSRRLGRRPTNAPDADWGHSQPKSRSSNS
ncbi:MAG: sulfotransferase [Actinomycetota bacterium]|nr:sulfotransferase [Actinomycetota bacterium]